MLVEISPQVPSESLLIKCIKLLPPGLSMIKAMDFSIKADRTRGKEGRIYSSNLTNFFAESVQMSVKTGVQSSFFFYFHRHIATDRKMYLSGLTLDYNRKEKYFCKTELNGGDGGELEPRIPRSPQ